MYYELNHICASQSTIRLEVGASAIFDELLDLEDGWKYSVWRYVGMSSGTYRLFPATAIDKYYDHTHRSW